MNIQNLIVPTQDEQGAAQKTCAAPVVKTPTNNSFEDCIKEYIDKYAQSNKAFADKYLCTEKTISQCCKYIIEYARSHQNGGVFAMSDQAGYDMAVKFFEDDSISVKKETPVSEQSQTKKAEEEMAAALKSKDVHKAPAAPKNKVEKVKSTKMDAPVADIWSLMGKLLLTISYK